MNDASQFSLTMAGASFALLGVLLLTPWGRRGFANLLSSIRDLFIGRTR